MKKILFVVEQLVFFGIAVLLITCNRKSSKKVSETKANPETHEVYERPVGLATANEGSLPGTNDALNTIWKVTYMKVGSDASATVRKVTVGILDGIF